MTTTAPSKAPKAPKAPQAPQAPLPRVTVSSLTAAPTDGDLVIGVEPDRSRVVVLLSGDAAHAMADMLHDWPGWAPDAARLRLAADATHDEPHPVP